MCNSKLAQYRKDAGDDEVRAAELLARDLMMGDTATRKVGFTAESAARAAIKALHVNLQELAAGLLTARLEAWSEGHGERRAPDGRVEDYALLRCPECCSEVGAGPGAGLSVDLNCENCGERFERGAALVTVAEIEQLLEDAPESRAP